MAAEVGKLIRQARTPVEGPEMELLSKALSNGLLLRRQLARREYFEPRMPTGYPDLVVVYSAKRRSHTTKARSILTVEHLRLAHQLHHDGGRRVESLAEALCIPKDRTAALVDDLVKAGVVWERGGYATRRAMSDVFPVRHIVAIECKVNDWRRALRQAIANTWFASESYILIPATSAIGTIEAECQEAGIGVMVFDGSRVKKHIEAQRTPIPASYGSWIVNEWVVGDVRQRPTWM